MMGGFAFGDDVTKGVGKTRRAAIERNDGYHEGRFRIEMINQKKGQL